MTARGLVLLCALGLVAPTTLAAEPVGVRVAAPGPRPAQAVADRLARGERRFADQDYREAIALLVPVTRDPAASRAQRVRAWEVIALARFITGDEAGAKDAFERVLELDPEFQLRDASGSPRVRAFFDRLRREARPDAAGEVDLEHAAPSGATAGASLELEVRVTRGAPSVREVVVAYRPLGTLAFREAAGRRHGERWRIAVRLPPARERGVVEYYVIARGADGSAAARIATPDAPLALTVAPGGGTGARPWYGRWYVIAGVAVVAAGATGAVLAGTGGPGDGSLPPGTITVTP